MTDINTTIGGILKNYNVLGIIDLASSDIDDRQLYNQLQSLHRPVFESTDRIVVIQRDTDVYDYDNLPGQFVIKLQKYVSQIDTSNFFVLVVTSNQNIACELEQARQLYSTDDTPIQSIVVSGPFHQVVLEKDTFCPYPWMHLYVGPDSNVLPCCVGDQNYPLGNVSDQSIDSIAKSDKFNKLRYNMLNKKRSKECQYCYVKEDNQLPSPRLGAISRWGNSDSFVDKDHVDGKIKSFEPVYLDIRLNNICNLKCRMCSGYFSSAIAQEEISIYGNTKFKNLSGSTKQRQQAFNNIAKHIPQAEKIYFAGGEPLLAPEHYQILEMLVDCGNTNVELVYNTNFTTTTYRNTSVFDLWKKFKNVKIGASLDAHGKVAEYIRHGTKWTEIEQNLNLLKKYCPDVKFAVTSTVGLLNVESLIFLQQQWHKSGLLEIQHFSLTVMISPDHLTVSVLPIHHKQRLESMIVQHIDWCQDKGASNLAKQWDNVLKYMWLHDHSHHLDEFKRLTNNMDTYRGQSLIAVLPQYQDLL